VLQHDSRDGDTLPLASGKLDAALADERVVTAATMPVGEFPDELVSMRARRGRQHVVPAGIRPAISNVVVDRTVQQRSVLRHHADGASQAFLRHLGDILAVYANTPGIHIVKT